MENSIKQNLFLEQGHKGMNIFLTGKAGTGKSHILQKLVQEFTDKSKNVLVVAPTGVAANNVGGQTMHSLFNIDIHGVLDFQKARFVSFMKRRIYKKADVVIVDEVSMLRPDILDVINYTMMKNGCGSLVSKQLIFVGDLKQLPAPIDDNTKSKLLEIYDGIEFTYAKIYKNLKVIEIELDEVLRQSDPDFIENLNIIRNGGKSSYFKKFISKEPSGVILAPHNSTVSMYNKEGLAKIDSKEIIYEAVIEGKAKISDFTVPQTIRVKEGAKIMYLVNSQNNDLINGTIGIFRLNDDNLPMIDVNGIEYLIESREFVKKEYVLDEEENELILKEIGSIVQMPFKLAYALTIHKSQGLTFDEVSLDLSIPCFQSGQLYVGLSRVKSPEGLKIIVNRN